MTQTEFIFWLKGFLDKSDSGGLDSEDIKMIEENLLTVKIPKQTGQTDQGRQVIMSEPSPSGPY